MKKPIKWLKAPLLSFFPDKWKAWLVCLSANLFCFYQVMQSNMLNSLNAPLLKTFSISATTMGYLSASYFYASVLFIFIAGFLIDKISRRVILISTCFINVLSISFFAIAQAPWQIFICHFVTGFAEAFSLTATIRLATQWFSRQHLTGIIGLMGGIASLGGIIAQAPFVISIAHFGWRKTLLFDAILGAIILITIIAFVQDKPKLSKDDSKIVGLKSNNFQKSFKECAKNIQNWLTGIYAGLMTLPLFLLGALWGNLYLVQAHHFTPQQAALSISMMFVGAVIGAPILGGVSDYFSTRKIPMQISALIGFGLSLLLLSNTFSSPILFYIFFFLLGSVTGAQSVAYAFVPENNRKEIISSAQGFVATLMMMSGFLQNLFSSLIEWKWNHQYTGDMPLYAISDYHRAMIILPITFTIAFLLARKLKNA